MPCTRCGGTLAPDRPVSAVEAAELLHLGLVFDRCMSCARRLPVGLTCAPIITGVPPVRCPQHGLERPCRGCSEEMRAKRQRIAPAMPLCACGCGVPIPPGRTKYASTACAYGKNRTRGVRGKTLSRTELLQQRELLRVGLYR